MKGNNIIIFLILFPILSKLLFFKYFKLKNIFINNVIVFPLHIIITNIMDQYYIFHNIKYYIDSININRVMGILFK